MKRKLDTDPDPDHSSRKIADITRNLESDSEQDKVDFISSLPHDTLRRIFSLLPFKSVVKTSLLSTKWKILWKMAFLVENGTIDDAAMAIFQFLDDYNGKSRKKNWALQFNFGEGNVLFAAISPYNRTLHLEFFAGNCHEPPRHFKWLLQPKSPPISVYYSNYLSSYTSLVRTLHLFGVDRTTCWALVEHLFLKFPHLKNLTIEKCKGLRSLRLFGRSGLQRLTILDCLELKCIHLEDSNIQSFRYRGKLVSYKVKNLDSYYPCMEDVMLDCRQGLGCKSYKILGFPAMLGSLTNVQCLTLCRWAFEPFLIPGTFRFKWLKTLWWIDYSKEKYESDSLIAFVKLCPRLTKLYVTIDASSYRKSTGSVMCPPNVMGALRRSKLEFVKLEGFESEQEEIGLAIQLIKEFKVDPDRVIAQSKGSYLRHLVEMLNDGEVAYKFEKLDSTDNICKKYHEHVHMGI